MLIGAIAGVLAFASAPVSSSPTPLPPTPAPLSDKLTVIMCGAVLGESFDTTRARLGAPGSQMTVARIVYQVYSVDNGAAECLFRVDQERVVDIYERLTGNQSDPGATDPYGVSLGTLYRELISKRGDPRIDIGDEEEFIYPSRSGACWQYGLGRGQQRKDVVVTSIRVFLNLDRGFDCFTR